MIWYLLISPPYFSNSQPVHVMGTVWAGDWENYPFSSSAWKPQACTCLVHHLKIVLSLGGGRNRNVKLGFPCMNTWTYIHMRVTHIYTYNVYILYSCLYVFGLPFWLDILEFYHVRIWPEFQVCLSQYVLFIGTIRTVSVLGISSYRIHISYLTNQILGTLHKT